METSKFGAAAPQERPTPELETKKSLTSAVESSENNLAAPNPFDIGSLRAPQPLSTITRVTLSVSAVMRPPKDRFIRVMQFDDTWGDEKNCLNVQMVTSQVPPLRQEQNFIVPPGSDSEQELKRHIRTFLVVVGVTSLGSFFLWELRIPSFAHDIAGTSRIELAKQAQTQWLRPVWDGAARSFQKEVPDDPMDNPDWSYVDFHELFRLAYPPSMIIDSNSHPILKELRGRR